MKDYDYVHIEQLEVSAIIGVYEWERHTVQKIYYDLTMAWDISKAAETDEISHALDYKAVTKRLISYAQSSRFYLIESLAEKSANMILSEFSVPWLRLKLSKPLAVKGSKNVAITIERGSRAT